VRRADVFVCLFSIFPFSCGSRFGGVRRDRWVSDGLEELVFLRDAFGVLNSEACLLDFCRACVGGRQKNPNECLFVAGANPGSLVSWRDLERDPKERQKRRNSPPYP